MTLDELIKKIDSLAANACERDGPVSIQDETKALLVTFLGERGIKPE